MAAPKIVVTNVVLNPDGIPVSIEIDGTKHNFSVYMLNPKHSVYAGFIEGLEGMHDLLLKNSVWTIQYEGYFSAGRE